MARRRFFGGSDGPDDPPGDELPGDERYDPDEEATRVTPSPAPTEEYRDVRDAPRAVEEVEDVRRAGPPPERTWWPWLLALLLLVLGAIAAIYFLTRDNDHKKPVPAVVGAQRQQAVNALGDAGFKATVRVAFSAKAKGTVIQQIPAAGRKAKKGSTVTIVVSKGPSTVSVPNLRGLTEAAAGAKLAAAGLKPNVFRVPSSQPSGTVIAQQPPPDQRVQRGTKVRINVSKGVTETSTTTIVSSTVATSTTTASATATRSTTTTSTASSGTTTSSATTSGGGTAPAAKKVTVPDVTGQTETAAASQLQSAGLLADSYPVTSSQAGGTVVAQTPASGTLTAGSVVRLNVAIGSGPRAQKQIPSVKGMEEKAARARLRSSGFTVRAVYKATKNKAYSHKVIFQTPAAGTTVRVRFQVTIEVGRLAGSAAG
jgi:eukaryotic-like serine/threonine-protein kinase